MPNIECKIMTADFYCIVKICQFFNKEYSSQLQGHSEKCDLTDN
jgi:hypothetical protein